MRGCVRRLHSVLAQHFSILSLTLEVPQVTIIQARGKRADHKQPPSVWHVREAVMFKGNAALHISYNGTDYIYLSDEDEPIQVDSPSPALLEALVRSRDASLSLTTTTNSGPWRIVYGNCEVQAVNDSTGERTVCIPSLLQPYLSKDTLVSPETALLLGLCAPQG